MKQKKQRHQIRLYEAQQLSDGTIVIDDDRVHYIANVMRRSVGDAVHLFNDNDGQHEYVIEIVNRQHIILRHTVKILDPIKMLSCHLYLPPLKKQAMHYAIEKATECGVTDIHLVRTEFTDKSFLSLEKMIKISLDATQQSGRFDVPRCHDMVRLDNILNDFDTTQILMVAAEDHRAKDWPTVNGDNPTHILIGPEGGFSSVEFDLLATKPYVKFVTLGKNILRAETAIVSALTAINISRH